MTFMGKILLFLTLRWGDDGRTDVLFKMKLEARGVCICAYARNNYKILFSYQNTLVVRIKYDCILQCDLMPQWINLRNINGWGLLGTCTHGELLDRDRVLLEAIIDSQANLAMIQITREWDREGCIENNSWGGSFFLLLFLSPRLSDYHRPSPFT